MRPSEELPSTPGAPLWTRAQGRNREKEGWMVDVDKNVEKTESERHGIQEMPEREAQIILTSLNCGGNSFLHGLHWLVSCLTSLTY